MRNKVANIKERQILMAKDMVKANVLTLMDRFMKVIGQMDLDQVMEL